MSAAQSEFESSLRQLQFVAAETEKTLADLKEMLAAAKIPIDGDGKEHMEALEEKLATIRRVLKTYEPFIRRP